MDDVEGRRHQDRGAPKEERHSCVGDRMRREIQCGVVARIGQQSNGGSAACGEGRRGMETSPGGKTWRDYCLRGLKMSLHSIEAGKMTYIEQEVNARQPL
jgi:hypothetical protein